jgi:flagellar biosynthesis protein FliP
MSVLSQNSTFWRFCDDSTCQIDWRLTLKGGVESHALTVVNIINVAWSSVLLVCGIGLIIHRIVFKGHRIWERQDNGRLRPKPIEAMLTLLMIFTLVRIIDSIVLLTDVASNRIATTLAQSHQAISTGWLPSSRQVDILAVFLIFAPFVTNNICSITAGVYAQQGRYYIADVITRMLYAFCT